MFEFDKKNAILIGTVLGSTIAFYIYRYQKDSLLPSLSQKSNLGSTCINHLKEKKEKKKEKNGKRKKIVDEILQVGVINRRQQPKNSRMVEESRRRPRMPKSSPPVRFHFQTTKTVIPTLILPQSPEEKTVLKDQEILNFISEISKTHNSHETTSGSEDESCNLNNIEKEEKKDEDDPIIIMANTL